jgi:hypothetical protein
MILSGFHAEWVKFRSVRGWVIGVLVAVLAVIGVGQLNHDSCSDNGAACTLPVGPGGQAVDDSFYFVHQSLAGDGTLTARITSLTGAVGSGSGGVARAGAGVPQVRLQPGLQPWSKAGIIVKASTSQGSAYAAMLVTSTHGVRMSTTSPATSPGWPDRCRPLRRAGCAWSGPDHRSPATTRPTACTGPR